jgi:CheY-like chemotaxis protein
MQDFSSCLILLVDDRVDNMDILVDILADSMEVMVAMDGAQALEAIAQDRPDLILLDIEMPDMDGFEVLSRLRQCPETADIPVAFLSGRTRPEDRAQAQALGAVDFIAKPFQAQEVLNTVQAILRQQRPSPPTSTTGT